MPIITEVWRNTYYDSVTLMLGSSMMEALPGIDEAMVLMGTDRNDTVIRASGLLADGCGEFGSNSSGSSPPRRGREIGKPQRIRWTARSGRTRASTSP